MSSLSTITSHEERLLLRVWIDNFDVLFMFCVNFCESAILDKAVHDTVL